MFFVFIRLFKKKQWWHFGAQRSSKFQDLTVVAKNWMTWHLKLNHNKHNSCRTVRGLGNTINCTMKVCVVFTVHSNYKNKGSIVCLNLLVHAHCTSTVYSLPTSIYTYMYIRGWLIITTITDARSFLHGMEAITKH